MKSTDFFSVNINNGISIDIILPDLFSVIINQFYCPECKKKDKIIPLPDKFIHPSLLRKFYRKFPKKKLDDYILINCIRCRCYHLILVEEIIQTVIQDIFDGKWNENRKITLSWGKITLC